MQQHGETHRGDEIQRRGDRRRRELVEATLRVIGREGARAVSHRSVAAEAEVPLGSTTYYFSSKDDILTQTLRFAARTEIEALERQVDELDPSAISTEEWVESILDWLDRQLRDEARLRLVALYSLQLEAVHRPELRAVYEEWTFATVRLAQRLLQRAGAPDPASAAPMFVAAIDGLRHNQLATRDAGLSRRAAHLVVEHLVHRLVGAGR